MDILWPGFLFLLVIIPLLIAAKAPSRRVSFVFRKLQSATKNSRPEASRMTLGR